MDKTKLQACQTDSGGTAHGCRGFPTWMFVENEEIRQTAWKSVNCRELADKCNFSELSDFNNLSLFCDNQLIPLYTLPLIEERQLKNG